MKKIFTAIIIFALSVAVTTTFARRHKNKPDDNAMQEKLKARERIAEDAKKYSRKQIKEIERLYRSQGYMNGSIEKTKNLNKLISKYSNSNRAGCAMLTLGIYNKTFKEQEYYLKEAFNKYENCFYGNGVQVGPYARFWLAKLYLKNGKKKQAYNLFKQVKEKYPNAIDPRNMRLSLQINRILGKQDVKH